QWEGRVNGQEYFGVGTIAFATKVLLDFFVLTLVFHHKWTPLFYWRPLGAVTGVLYLDNGNARVALAMLFLSLPFLWLGVAMTAKRLRDADRPLWGVCLFFVPILNFLAFIVFCFFRSVPQPHKPIAAPWPDVKPFGKWIPRSKWGSALLATILAAFLGL